MVQKEVSIEGVRLPFVTAAPGLSESSTLEVVKQGEVLGKIPLHRAITLFGRNSKMSHEVMEHQSISRRHAALAYSEGGELHLVDLGSVHGSFVGNEKVKANEALALKAGDEIKFGGSTRTYRVCKSVEKPAQERVPKGGKGGNFEAEVMKVDTGGIDDQQGGGSNINGKGKAEDAWRQTPATRSTREAEIAAMMEGLDKPATFVAPERVEEEEEEEEEEDSDEGVEHDDAEGGAVTEADRVAMAIQRLQLPVSHEAVLSGHSKAVAALAADPSGARLASGGRDYKVKLYDFGGMDRGHRSFREMEPEEGNVIVALDYSPSGDKFLCCTGSSQPLVYDRDGAQLIKFVRGDMYIKDMALTKGHVTRTTGGEWHPSDRSSVMTCGVDGTVRMWNLNGPTTFEQLHCASVVKVKNARGMKVQVTCASFNADGTRVAAGGEDGSLHLLQANKLYGKACSAKGHGQGSEVTAVAWHEEGNILASRGMDDCICIWDIRRFKEPVKVLPGIATHVEGSNMAFGPDGTVLCAGSNVPPKETTTPGTISFFNVYGEETAPAAQLGVSEGSSVIKVLWHPRIKQIFASTSAGSTKVLYDPTISLKGAMMSTSRKVRAKQFDYAANASVGTIFTPHSLPMFKEDTGSKKRKLEKARRDPKKTKLPDCPVPGRATRIKAGNVVTQFVKNKGLVVAPAPDKVDARAELLKYANGARNDPFFFGDAYKSTQPGKHPKLAPMTLEEEAAKFEVSPSPSAT
ncbi:unnamed protein product [Chrysoparadoxa australica]